MNLFVSAYFRKGYQDFCLEAIDFEFNGSPPTNYTKKQANEWQDGVDYARNERAFVRIDSPTKPIRTSVFKDYTAKINELEKNGFCYTESRLWSQGLCQKMQRLGVPTSQHKQPNGTYKVSIIQR